MEPFPGDVGLELLARGQDVDVYASTSTTNEGLIYKAARVGSPFGPEHIRYEAQVLDANRHPGVVELVSSDLHAQRPWFATRMHRRDAWAGAWSKAQLAQDDSHHDQRLRHLRLLRHLADTLAWVHGRGIVHCDIKPTNIVVNSDDYPILIDFGISQCGERETRVPNGPVGTFAFSAPEQLRCEALDPRADLYALGGLLLLTLVGEPPKPRMSVQQWEALEQRLSHAQVSAKLRDLTLALLQPELGKRLAYADEAAHVLQMEVGVRARPGLPAPRPYLCRPTIAGRENLLSRLRDERVCATAGRGNFVLLSGISGVGKSRLLESHAQLAAVDGFQVVHGRCGELGRRDVEPLQGLRPLLQRIAAHTDPDDPTLAPLLRSRAAVLAAYEPGMTRWCSDPAAAERAGAANPAPPAQVQASVLSLIHAFCDQRPTTLLFDDAQWADDLTLAVLRDFVTKPWIAPSCMIVVGVRSEEMPSLLAGLREQARFRVLTVGDLSHHSIRPLVADLLGGSRIMDAWVDSLYAHSAGNPLMIAAALEHGLAQGSLKRENGSWVSDGDGRMFTAPSESTEPILRRVAAVTGPARSLLLGGAVLGRRFDLRVAAELSQLDHDGVSAALAELRSLRIVDQEGPWSFCFVHDKLLEGAYSSMSNGERAQLHATALTLMVDRASTAELARHAAASGNHEMCLRYSLKAASEAVSQGRYRQGAEYLDQAEHHRSIANFTLTGLEVAEIAMSRAEISGALYDFATCAKHARVGLAALGIAVPQRRTQWVRSLFSAAIRQIWLRCSATNTKIPSPDSLHRWTLLARFYYALGGCMVYDNGSPLAFVACELHAANAAERSRHWGWAARCTSLLGLIFGTARLRGLASKCFVRGNQWALRAQIEGDDKPALFCDMQEGLYHYMHSEPEAARLAITRRTEQAIAQGPSIELLQNLGICGAIAFGSGDIHSARRYTELLRELGRLTDTSDATAEGKIIELAILLSSGDLEQSIEMGFATASELAERGSLVLHCSALAVAAVALARLDRRQEATTTIETIHRLMPDSGAKNFAAIWLHTFLPEAVLQMAERAELEGERARWLEHAGRSVKAASTFCKIVPRALPRAVYYRARWLAVRGRLALALRAAARAQILATRMGQPFERAQALALTATLQRVQGKPNEAIEQLAIQSFQALESRWHTTLR